MGFDDQFPADVSKRQFLKLTGGGAVAGTGLASTTAGRQSQRPTVTVEATGCKQLTVTYSSGQVPLRVSLDGPSPGTFSLRPGMVVQRPVEPGSYSVEATPAQGASQSAGSIRVEGSPATVEDCAAVRTRAYCESSYVTIEYTSTATESVVVWTTAHSGDRASQPGMFTMGSEGRAGVSYPVETFLELALTHVTFEAEFASTGDPVPVRPDRIDFPGELSCLQP